MTTLYDAYDIIKACSDDPITYLLETDECYWGDANDYTGVKKESGEVVHIQRYGEFLWRLQDDKFVDLEDLYTDYLDFYKKNNDENSLARLYVGAWNRLFFHETGNEKQYKSEENRKRMITRWKEIEQVLYNDIRNIMDNDGTIYYPPCVKNKYDDPFYRIKPFMLRNGFTDNDVRRTWVRS